MKRIYEDAAYGSLPLEESYWRTTVSDTSDWPQLQDGIRCDFAIVGGGYTGLTAALDLAEAGADVVMLEAETPGWGASGRNGGFCCLGGSKLSPAQIARKYGPDDAALFHRMEMASVDLVFETLDRLGIDADTHSRGETLLTHRPDGMAALREEAEVTNRIYGTSCDLLVPGELAEHGMSSPEFHGAMTVPIGFALNPLKYVLGLANAARAAGAQIFGNSMVTEIRQDGGRWHVSTGQGRVNARTLLVATNGYSSDDLPEWLAGRYLPVQSNILVTRELTPDELKAQGWTSNQMSFDTRHLLHYFRLMPNNRMLFGQRGGIRSDRESHARFRKAVRADFDRFFPAWRDVETPHFWSGLLAMSYNLTPFAGPIGDKINAFAALCYNGNGVATGSLSGGLLADLALGRKSRRPYPALMQRPPKRFPLGRFRRNLLPAAYKWYQVQDRI